MKESFDIVCEMENHLAVAQNFARAVGSYFETVGWRGDETKLEAAS